MYLTYVDPGASRATHPMMKIFGRVIAWFGRVRGVRMVGVNEPVPSRAV